MKTILDNGYVELIETWGSDERIIEAARMSVDKGFTHWGGRCPECGGCGESTDGIGAIGCPKCGGSGTLPPGDEKLLAYLYNNKHSTPFEMAGMIIEVKAPIFIFREWHRHRTQSYNEMSARYIPLPDENYMPSLERMVEGSKATGNKQAVGTKELNGADGDAWRIRLHQLYNAAQQLYADGIEIGVPKELARLSVPVARYSRMRASANLRNWIGFLTLREAPNAQWEIRQYAHAVAKLVQEHFPRTYALYERERNA